MHKPETLQPGNFYHIYNRGINSCNIFTEQRNYNYFIRLYEKYIFQIADTFAWVLMPNHFHFLVKITSNSDRVQNPVRVEGKKSTPSLQFSKLFNAYAQAFNKQQNQKDSLFMQNFKRKLIDSDNYFKQKVKA